MQNVLYKITPYSEVQPKCSIGAYGKETPMFQFKEPTIFLIISLFTGILDLRSSDIE